MWWWVRTRWQRPSASSTSLMRSSGATPRSKPRACSAATRSSSAWSRPSRPRQSSTSKGTSTWRWTSCSGRSMSACQRKALRSVVAVHRLLPGRPEALRLQAVGIDAQLVDVLRARALVEAVEQHALLHRRQRVDVLQLRRRQRQAVQLLLGERHQREVGRRNATVVAGTAVLDQLARLRIGIGQALQRRLVEALAAEAPVDGQLPVVDLAVQHQAWAAAPPGSAPARPAPAPERTGRPRRRSCHRAARGS